MIDSALLIGCGGVGANYDINSDDILTHAKALFKCNWIRRVDLFDINKLHQKTISKKYNFISLNSKKKINYKNYDLVVISTPTDTHFEYLKLCIESNVPLVVCEKPVSNSAKELNKLLKLYKSSDTRIIVNYFRRFQKSYLNALSKLDFITNNPNKINIKYHKGFLNNAGHALDFIEFFLKKPLEPKKVEVLNKNYDFFKKDPTISANFISQNIEFKMIGMDLNNKLFEIKFLYDNYKLILKELGDKIVFFKGKNLIFEFENLTNNYMVDVYDTVKNIYLKEKLKDNFIESIILNQKQINKFIL